MFGKALHKKSEHTIHMLAYCAFLKHQKCRRSSILPGEGRKPRRVLTLSEAAGTPRALPDREPGCGPVARTHTSPTIIRAAGLHLLPGVHLPSIYQVVFLGSYPSRKRTGESRYLGVGFALRCFQRFSLLDVAIQPWGRPPNWPTSGPAISVLSY